MNREKSKKDADIQETVIFLICDAVRDLRSSQPTRRRIEKWLESSEEWANLRRLMEIE